MYQYAKDTEDAKPHGSVRRPSMGTGPYINPCTAPATKTLAEGGV